MIAKSDAVRIRELGLRAIESLHEAITIAQQTATPETLEAIKRGVGLSIGTIDGDVLAVLYSLHPDLDHLAPKKQE